MTIYTIICRHDKILNIAMTKKVDGLLFGIIKSSNNIHHLNALFANININESTSFDLIDNLIDKIC